MGLILSGLGYVKLEKIAYKQFWHNRTFSRLLQGLRAWVTTQVHAFYNYDQEIWL